MKTDPSVSRGGRTAVSARLLITALLFAAVLAAACAGKTARLPPRAADPARVVAHSSGLVSAAAPVRIVFAREYGSAGAAAPQAAFSFFPPLAGAAAWEDARTLAFTPARPLGRGLRIRADVDLGLLGGSPAGGADYFSLELMASAQRVSVETEPPRVLPDGSLELRGSLSLSDRAENGAVESALRSSAGELSWEHESALLHRFTVSRIARPERAGAVEISWKAAPLGGTGSGSTRVELPSEVFSFLGARGVPEAAGGAATAGAPVPGGPARIELSFSEALDEGQDLRGIVTVANVEDLRCAVSGSVVSLYASSWPDEAVIDIGPSLRSRSGESLGQPAAASLALPWEKPQARWLSKGVILPTSQGTILPLETMNLAGVIVEALAVPADSMLQFLQVNALDGKEELRRVGEVIWKETIDLGWKDEWKNRWVRQGLDLGPLVAARKDGMVQIRVTFRHDQIRYVPAEPLELGGLSFPDERILDPDSEDYSFWDYAEQWANGWEDFERYKGNPDHPAYYLPTWDHDITIRRNVVVSDLGAAIKREADGDWHVAVSDLRTARPLPGAEVILYNYQRRELARALTPATGIAVLRPAAGGAGGASGVSASPPAFVTVRAGSQASWLRVDEGSTLSVGHFDVGGAAADSGLKGFIYGERGVWRPGDAMRLVFILNDRAGLVPGKYPVTWELEDPLGRITRTGTVAESVGGFYALDASTAPDAPTGTWTVRARAGGRSFSKALRVETVMPNRLKLALGWGEEAWLSRDTGSMDLTATWLTGATAGALRADVSAVFGGTGSSFAGFPDYSFTDPTRALEGGRAVLFQGELGEEGTASFDVELSPGGAAPGVLKAEILSRVFEPSGLFSSESVSVDFHPYERYVGLKLPRGDAARGMLLTDRDQRVDLALVDRAGKPVRSGKVEVSLYRLEWRWWWEKGEESLAERAAEFMANPVATGTATIGSDGRGSWSFQVKYPAWGRYLVRARDLSGGGDRGGGGEAHAAGAIAYIDWPGWAGKSRDQGGAAASLELSAGKEGYALGEKASVSFPSNAESGALVTVERSGTVLREEWIKTGKETTLYEFPVTPDMAPNVYVHVTLLQPHLQTANDLPLRLYGIIPVRVEDPATRLKPVISAPAALEPGKEAWFSVREASGRPMTWTVAVVDEGLLGITRYATQNPWDEFYRKEASALGSWDLYDQVAGAWSGSLETLLAIGGSDEALGGGNRKPSRFPPVVRFFGPRLLAAGETATEKFTLGTYIGAVRIMVVAGAAAAGALPVAPAGGATTAVGTGAAVAGGAGAGAAFGTAELSVPVRADLMAMLTAPRSLSPGETATIPATVFSFGGKRRVTLELKAEGALSLGGSGKKTIDFAADGDQVASFTVKAGNAPGGGRLSLVATAAGSGGAQLLSSEAIDLEVRSVGVTVSKTTQASVEGGKSWSGKVALPGAAGTNRYSVELARLKPLSLAERVDWLIAYPHGCAEQVTSAAFPQLWLPKAVSLEQGKAEVASRNVSAAIIALRSFQTPRGGFSLWPGQDVDDDWVTPYVVHFLVSARREGYDVPAGLLDPALALLSRTARGWNSTLPWSEAAQAYRLYGLALAGKPEAAAMNRLRDHAAMPASARWRLAAAYALAGNRQAATELTRGRSLEPADYEGLADRTYGTPLRDRAIILDALLAMGDTTQALAVYNRLAADLDSGRWLSTQEIGVALAAALPYALLAAKGEVPELRVTTPAGWTGTLRLDKPLARLDPPAPTGAEAAVTVENRGSKPVYIRLVAQGVPAPGTEKSQALGLSLTLRYLDMDERVVQPAAIPAGSDFIIETTVRNRSGQELRNIALSQLLPSGWEIVDFRPAAELPSPGDAGYSEEYVTGEAAAPPPDPAARDWQDIRDDRVLTYFGLGARDTRVFRVYANRTYEGIFFLPAVTASAMYDSRWQAVVPGRWLGTPLP